MVRTTTTLNLREEFLAVAVAVVLEFPLVMVEVLEQVVKKEMEVLENQELQMLLERVVLRKIVVVQRLKVERVVMEEMLQSQVKVEIAKQKMDLKVKVEKVVVEKAVKGVLGVLQFVEPVVLLSSMHLALQFQPQVVAMEIMQALSLIHISEPTRPY